MQRVKFGKKVRKFIAEIIPITYSKDISTYFEEIEEFRKLALKIPDQEQEKYEQYFAKHMTHQINLVQINQRKIEMKHRDCVHGTSKQSAKFNSLLADPKLKQHMRIFYQREYLKILNPMYFLEQLKENYSKYWRSNTGTGIHRHAKRKNRPRTGSKLQLDVSLLRVLILTSNCPARSSVGATSRVRR